MWACASPNACGGCRQDLAPATFGLRADRRKEIAQHAPHSVQLIDEIEDDGNALLVHAEFPQAADQLHSCEIDLGKWPGFAAIARQQPAGLDPRLKRCGFEMRRQEKFSPLHGHTPIASRGLRSVVGRHSAMNFSSSGSGLPGSITFRLTY